MIKSGSVLCFLWSSRESIYKAILYFLWSSTFSGFPNLSKCETAGIGVLIDGLTKINSTKESIKILGVHLSYNGKFQNELNFCTTIKNICNVTKLWRIKNLSLEGKITIFKSLAISKIVYLALHTIVPKNVIFELKEIQINFYGQIKKCKIKHSTLCNDYKNGGLKNVEIELKILVNYIHNTLGKNVTFHSNLSIPNKTLIPPPPFQILVFFFFLFSKCSFFYFFTVLMVQFIFEN